MTTARKNRPKDDSLKQLRNKQEVEESLDVQSTWNLVHRLCVAGARLASKYEHARKETKELRSAKTTPGGQSHSNGRRKTDNPKHREPVAARVADAPSASPLRWHGGKGADHGKLAKWIISQMPPHIHYVEPYFGGGSVLFYKDAEGQSELINDLHGQLMNFYRVLRDPDQFEELQRLLSLTPLSRDEFTAAQCDLDQQHAVEAGRLFFIFNRQSRQGLMKDFATPVRSRTRRGMADPVSAYLSSIDGLEAIHQRIQRVQIENIDAIELIKREDKPHTHIYCDPPYLHETRVAKQTYAHEMTADQHSELLDVLAGLQHATWQLSGYHSGMYDRWAIQHGVRCEERVIDNKASNKKRKEKKTECLWMNY